MSFAQVTAAAGKFSASQVRPDLADDEKHPVNKWATKMPMVRKMMVGSHPLIVGLGFLDRNFNVRILSAPCPDLDNFEHGSKLGGSLGDSAFSATHVVMNEEKLFGDIMTLVPASVVPENGILTVGSLQRLTEDEIAPDTTCHTAVLPVSFPLLAEHGVTEGPISSVIVRASLKAYTPVTGVWAEAAAWLEKHPNCSHHLEPFEESVCPPKEWIPIIRASMTVKYETLFDPADGNSASLFVRINDKISAVRDKNTVTYYKEHPDEERVLSVEGSVSLHPDAGGYADSASIASNRLSSSLRLKRVEPFMKLFGATIGVAADNPQEEIVILPELSEAFGEIFNESSATNMLRSFRNQLEHHCRLREDSVYFLDKQTELPHLSQAAGLLFICYKWKTDPLDENVQGISQELSIITYLPPP